MELHLTEIIRGRRFRLYILGSTTQTPAHDFLHQLEQTHPQEHTKLLARLQHAADHGPPRNPEQCRQLKGSGPVVFELKTHKARLFWFYDQGQMIICTNGMLKGAAKVQTQAIATARQWQLDYEQAKQGQTLKIHFLP